MILKFKVRSHAATSGAKIRLRLESYYDLDPDLSQCLYVLVPKTDLDLYPLGGEVAYSIHGREPIASPTRRVPKVRE
jgi:hypothetical protein